MGYRYSSSVMIVQPQCVDVTASVNAPGTTCSLRCMQRCTGMALRASVAREARGDRRGSGVSA